MNTFTRREAFRVSGMALAAPLTVSIFSTMAHGQDLDSTPVSSTAHFSQDLISYLNDDLSMSVRRFKHGEIQPKHLVSLSNKVRLFAQHLDSSNLDSGLKLAIAQIPESTAQISIPTHTTDTISAVLKLHNPDLSASHLDLVIPTRSDLQASKAYLVRNGVVGHTHNLADALIAASVGVRYASSAHSKYPSSAHNLLYSREMGGFARRADLREDTHAQLLRVQSTCAANKPAICSQLAQWTNYSVGGILALLGAACVPVILAGINATFPGIGGALDIACAFMALDPVAAVAAVTGLVSLIIAGIQLAIC